MEKAILVFGYEFNVVKRFVRFTELLWYRIRFEYQYCWILNANADEIIGLSMTQFKEVYRRKFSIRSIGAGHI